MTRLLYELLSTISPEPYILEAVHVAGSWWLPWRNLRSPLTEANDKTPLLNSVHFNLAHKSLINVASAFIFIAISLLQMRRAADEYDIPFSGSHRRACNQNSDSGRPARTCRRRLASLDGFEALILRARSYINASNQLHRSWLLIRRAIPKA